MTNNRLAIAEKDRGKKGKCILITGARSTVVLELARQFSSAGHRIIAADTSDLHVSWFSNAVARFYTIPSPRYNTEEFIKTVSDIVEKEEVDFLIPVWEEVLYLSLYKDRFPKRCEIFCSSFKLTHSLHHKGRFMKLLESLEIEAPKSILLETNEDLETLQFKKPYVLKKCFSRGARHLLKVSGQERPKIQIEPGNPWIAQEFLEGKKFCSYSVCFQGKVTAHAVYPVQYTIDGSSCVAFEAFDHPKILNWVCNLVEKTGYTGQAAFDFIETNDGKLFAIECNPRATSGIHLFKAEDQLDRAFFNQTEKTILPKQGNSQQIALGMLIYGLEIAASEKKVPQYLKKLLTTKDVVFSRNDLKPFFFEPLVLASYWLKSKKRGITMPVLFTKDLEWDEDPRGESTAVEPTLSV